MEGKPQDQMKVGIIHFMAYPEVMQGEGPILETLKTICDDDYFQAVEVTRMKDAQIRQKAIGMVKDAGMSVGFGVQPPLLGGKLNLNAEDEAERKKAIEVSKAGVGEAYEWNAAGAAVLSGVDPGPEKRQQAKDLLIESLKELCAFSASKGEIPVLLETFDRQPYGKNCVIGPTDEAVEVAQAVRSDYPSFGLMLDLSHLPLLGEDSQTCLSSAKEYVKHIHIGNCVMRNPDHPAYGDNHPMFSIEGGENGVDELAEFLKALSSIGYIGCCKENIVSFEVKPFGDQTSQEVIQNAKETLNQAWAKC